MQPPLDLASLHGLSVAAARALVEARGLAFRVLTEDGVSRPSTADYRDDRVNVVVTAGKVTYADRG